MTDLTVLGEFVYAAVGIISWIGVAAVACSIGLLVLFASTPTFDWLFTTSQRRQASAEDNAIKQPATSSMNLRSLQQLKDPAEDASADPEAKFPSNIYSDIYSTPLGTYVLPC